MNQKEHAILYDRLADRIHEMCKQHYGRERPTPSMQITDEIFPIIEPFLALEWLPRARLVWLREKLKGLKL